MLYNNTEKMDLIKNFIKNTELSINVKANCDSQIV